MSSLNLVQLQCNINSALFIKHLSQEGLQALHRNPETLLMDRGLTLCYEFKKEHSRRARTVTALQLSGSLLIELFDSHISHKNVHYLNPLGLSQMKNQRRLKVLQSHTEVWSYRGVVVLTQTSLKRDGGGLENALGCRL